MRVRSPAQLRDALLRVEDVPGGEVPEGDDDPGRGELDLAGEVGAARLDLLGERIAVPRWPAHDDVDDPDVVAGPAELLPDQTVEQLPAPADERLAEAVL